MNGYEAFFGFLTVVGTIITIYQATIAKKESIKAQKEAAKAEQYVNEITIRKKAIDLAEIKKGVENLHEKITRFMITKRGSNETKIYTEIFTEITTLLRIIPSEYSDIISNLIKSKDILYYCINNKVSLYQEKENGDTGYKLIENEIFIVLTLLKKRIDELN